MTTIRDVARAAQVAPSTVSFVLNGNQRVRPQTRKRVEAAVQSLGYKPRSNGRPRHRGAMQFAAVIGAKYFHPAAPLTESAADHRGLAGAQRLGHDHVLLSAIRRAAVGQGHHFNCFSGFGRVDQNTLFREAVESGELDGVVLMMESPEDGYLDWLLMRDLPVVVLNRTPTVERRFSYVEMDNLGGGQIAADYFLSQGHRRLAVIQSDPRYSYNRDRVAGFRSRVDRQAEARCQVESPANPDELRHVCRQVIAEGATAAFVTSDSLALDCMAVWDREGVAIPDQLSVIGFDNAGLAASSGLIPSSIGYDTDEIAHAAVNGIEQLCRRDGQLRVLSATIRTRFVERDTTARS